MARLPQYSSTSYFLSVLLANPASFLLRVLSLPESPTCPFLPSYYWPFSS